MSSFGTWLRKMRERLLGSAASSRMPVPETPRRPDQDSKRAPCSESQLVIPQGISVPSQTKFHQIVTTPRKPYLLQVGFDFGTAFSKCVIRDVALDKAWVFQPDNVCFPKLPFLIPGSETGA